MCIESRGVGRYGVSGRLGRMRIKVCVIEVGRSGGWIKNVGIGGN